MNSRCLGIACLHVVSSPLSFNEMPKEIVRKKRACVKCAAAARPSEMHFVVIPAAAQPLGVIPVVPLRFFPAPARARRSERHIPCAAEAQRNIPGRIIETIIACLGCKAPRPRIQTVPVRYGCHKRCGPLPDILRHRRRLPERSHPPAPPAPVRPAPPEPPPTPVKQARRP